jgi:hypothetical protein
MLEMKDEVAKLSKRSTSIVSELLSSGSIMLEVGGRRAAAEAVDNVE